MPSNIRVQILSADSFNGTTAFTGIWSPSADELNPRVSATQATVGRLSFAAQLRGGLSSIFLLARLWSVDVGGFVLAVRTATEAELLAGPGDDPPPEKLDALLSSRMLTTAWSAPILLGATDALTMTGGAANTVEFLFINVNSTAAVALMQALTTAAASSSVGGIVELTVTGAQAIPATTGHIVVTVDLASAANLTLPALDDSTIGDLVTFKRKAGSAGLPRIRTEDAADEVNGVSGVNATEYYLRSPGDAITYLRVAGGWVQQFGEQPYAQVSSALNPININAARAGTVYVVDSGAVLDNQLNLPDLDDVPEGLRVAHFNNGDERHLSAVATGDAVNGVTNGTRYVQPYQAAIYEATATGGWLGIGGGNQGQSNSGSGTFSPTAREVSGNVTTFRMTGGAGQALNLPSVAAVAIGSMIPVRNAGGAAHNFVPDGGDLINGANATVNDANNDRTLIIAMGPVVGWITIKSA